MHLPLLGRCILMAEAIIAKRGWGRRGAPSIQTVTITSNQVWTVPEHTGTISVRIFGGGGCGTSWSKGRRGGNGGCMNNAELQLFVGQQIPITIGVGGSPANIFGGTTSFGTYLSANGSLGSTGGSVEDDDGPRLIGGNGVYYGGGGGGGSYCLWSYSSRRWISRPTQAYDGGIYGGGGGSGGFNITPGYGEITGYLYYASIVNGSFFGGNGGTYGGGGGTGYLRYSNIHNLTTDSFGHGGTYGGNGGHGPIISDVNGIIAMGRADGTVGTDTSAWTNVSMLNGIYLRGRGVMGAADSYAGGGGGGFGGSGGMGTYYGGGGGGGYGGNGGNYGGGGGGYGSNGGDNGGGGGGYGFGADGGNNAGGGGGYFARGGSICGGGGGYGNGGDNGQAGGIGAGGAGPNGGGGQGICIIQYYGYPN